MHCSATSGASGAHAASTADLDRDPSEATPEALASGLVDDATDPATGDIDTGCLAGYVAEAATKDFDAASVAYDAIETQLVERNPADYAHPPKLPKRRALPPKPEQVAACTWLTEAELAVYAAEYERTGFGYRDYQGGEDLYGVALTNDALFNLFENLPFGVGQIRHSPQVLT